MYVLMYGILRQCYTPQVLKAPHGDLLSCMEMAKVLSIAFSFFQGF